MLVPRRPTRRRRRSDLLLYPVNGRVDFDHDPATLRGSDSLSSRLLIVEPWETVDNYLSAACRIGVVEFGDRGPPGRQHRPKPKGIVVKREIYQVKVP